MIIDLNWVIEWHKLPATIYMYLDWIEYYAIPMVARINLLIVMNIN